MPELNGKRFVERDDIHDSIWLWCHPTGCYNGRWNLPGESVLSPVVALSYMGIKNAVMVVFCDEPKPPFGDYAVQFSRTDKVVWSIIGDGGSKRNNESSDLAHVIALRKQLPNLRAGIMDDFFEQGRNGNLDRVKSYADALHAAGLELWVVLYGHQLDTPLLKEFLKICDVVSFWTWKARELPLLSNRFERLKNIAPDKKIALGCYLWDFGDSKPISIADMEFQCGFALDTWRAGLASDIIMLGSPLVGMDIEAVNWSRKWIGSLSIDPA